MNLGETGHPFTQRVVRPVTRRADGNSLAGQSKAAV